MEKILEPGEELPESWATAGTTGYDALAEVDGVLVDPAGEPALTALDTELAGGPVDYARLVHDCKREVTDGMLGSEVARLVRVIGELPGIEPEPADRGPGRAAGELPGLPQLPARRPGAPRRDRRRRPRRAVPTWSRPWTALHPVLAQAGTEAATRFEQTSGPVMAKGVEDSAYYRWARLRRAQRGGRRPRAVRPHGRGVPRRAAAPRWSGARSR